MKSPYKFIRRAMAIVLLSSMAVGAQTPTPLPQSPDFTLIVEGTFDAATLADFRKRVDGYAALRSRLEVGLPPLVVTEDADAIERFEHDLSDRIRHARSSRRGQLFSPSMAKQVKRMLRARLNEATLAAMMEDGPGEFDVDVNATYSKLRPLATMPPNLLAGLPDLPADLEYRFVGRHLILRDAKANMIIDEIPHAIRCQDCVPEPEEDATEH